MANSSQTQKAGDNATQMQVGTVVNNYVTVGVSEERAKEICKEQFRALIKEYSNEAAQTTLRRVDALENAMIPRLKQIDDKFRFLTDPAFLILLREAAFVAVSTDKKEDYDLLSELLGAHIQSGDERKKKAGIRRAIKVVDDIDSSALCGLSILFFMQTFTIKSNNLVDLLLRFSSTIAPFMSTDLPKGDAWLEHLDLLSAVRVLQFNTLVKMHEIFTNHYDGIICVGIKKDSEEYDKAVKILSDGDVSPSMLVGNELLDGYVRLVFGKKSEIAESKFYNPRSPINSLDNDKCRAACLKVWEFYSHESSLKKEVVDNFIKRWDEYECLKKLRSWWDNIPHSAKITDLGDALARANVIRCCPSLKPLI